LQDCFCFIYGGGSACYYLPGGGIDVGAVGVRQPGHANRKQAENKKGKPFVVSISQEQIFLRLAGPMEYLNLII
jgi:hypothetical protein